MLDLAINNGEIVDFEEGLYHASIGISGGEIKVISASPLEAEQEIDAADKVIAPGFIDIHMHEDNPDGENFPTFTSLLKMGVTTAVGGNCGSNQDLPSSYIKNFAENDLPLNLGMLAGYSRLRELCGVDDRYRAADEEELAEIKSLLGQELQSGAIGFSCGLEYTPGVPTSTLLELGRLVAGFPDKIFATHFRYDDRRSLEAMAEMIITARETGVRFQVSHIGSCAAYGYMEPALEMLTAADEAGVDIKADIYPYTAFSTSIGSAVFDQGCMEKWKIEFEDILVAAGEYRGRRCDENLFEFLRKKRPDTRVIGFTMQESEVKRAIRHPLVMISSDGHLENGSGHPRTTGTFPRVLGKHVRQEEHLDLVTAIAKMSRMPAERLGLKNRGVIAEDKKADMVIFDPATIRATSTYQNPVRTPAGIIKVIVNGRVAVSSGEIMDENAGMIIE